MATKGGDVGQMLNNAFVGKIGHCDELDNVILATKGDDVGKMNNYDDGGVTKTPDKNKTKKGKGK